MSDIERIDQRLSAVERAVVDGDVELDQLADLAALAEDVERLETRLEEHERRLAELEGTVDAVNGLVGNVETVNEGVERQADAAIAAVDRLEYRIDELERSLTKRGMGGDGRGGSDVTGVRPGTEPPALDSADADDRAAESGHASGISTSDPDSTGPTTETTSDEAPFGASGDVEATAGKLLEAPKDGTEADDADGATSSGLAVQQTIERRLSGSDDESSPESSSADDSRVDDEPSETSTDGGDDSSNLFSSLRTKLS